MNALGGQRAARPVRQGAAKGPFTGLARSKAGRTARLRPCAVKVDPNERPSLQDLLQSSMQQATMPAKEAPMPALPSLPSPDPQLQQNVMDRPVVTREALPTLPDPAVAVPADALPAPTPAPAAADAVLSSTSSSSGTSSVDPTPPPQLADAAAQAQDAAGALASDVGNKASELADAANAATSQAAEAASRAASDLTGALSGAASGVSGAVTDVTSTVTSAFSGATSSVTAGASGLLSQASSFFSQAKSSVDQALGGVTSTVGSSIEQVTSTTGSATQSLSTTINGAISSARAAVDAATAAFDSTFGGAVSAANDAVSGAVDALPAPAKDALMAVGAVVGAAASQAAEHPRAAAVVGAAVTLPAGVSWYKARYGGYAGELAPEQVLDLLYYQNAALIDIRDDEKREEDGIVEAKLAARAKVAAFPIQVSIPARIARNATSADELRLLVNAAYMTGLPQITSSLTKVVVMDSSGSGAARKVARALVSVGQPLAYTMKGGFEGWVEAGLPVAEGASYTASPVAFIGDNVEVLAGTVGGALENLKRPSVGVPVLGGAALGAAALYNYHTTLEYIGVLGLLVTFANKASQYSSPREALDDVVGTFQSLAQRVPGAKARAAAIGDGADDMAAGAGEGVERWDGSESSGAELETADK